MVHSLPTDQGFTLTEMLCVIAVIALMASFVIPTVTSTQVGNMQDIQVRAQGALEDARQFARANRTYVRVGLADVTGVDGTDGVAVELLYSTTGDLRNDSTAAFGNAAFWRAVFKPTVLKGVKIDNSLVPVTVTPVGTTFPEFTRKSGGRDVNYRMVLQFDPRGQMSVEPGKLARVAGIGLVNPRQPSNPVVLLLSGLSGKVQALRQEELKP